MPDSCIYCPREIDPSCGEGDHIIPAAFGEFDQARRFRRICVECNSALKVYEEELIRCSPSAIVRGLVGAMQSRRGAPIGRRGARGARSPQLFQVHPDHLELVREDSGEGLSVRPVDQLIIEAKSGTTHWIELSPGMTAPAVRRKLDRLRVSDIEIKLARVKSGDATADYWRALISELWPHWRYEDQGCVEPGMRATRGRIKFDSSVATHRAIAKVALHHYLTYSNAGFTGHEAQFEPVKRFIRGHGDGQGVLALDAFPLPLPAGLLANPVVASWTRYEHLVCVEEGPGFARAGVCMAFGREIPPSPSFVLLFSTHQARHLHLRHHRFGHRYIYRRSRRTGERAGYVEALPDW